MFVVYSHGVYERNMLPSIVYSQTRDAHSKINTKVQNQSDKGWSSPSYTEEEYSYILRLPSDSDSNTSTHITQSRTVEIVKI